MKLLSSSALVLLPVSCLASTATVYLHPPPKPTHESNARLPALSPYEANSILANHIGIAHTLFSEIIDDAVDFGRKEWEYLWDTVIPWPSASHEVNNEHTAMLFIQSDHPQDFMTLEPSFKIIGAPTPKEFSELFDVYVEKAYDVFDKVVTSFLEFPSSSSHSRRAGVLDIFDLTPSESTVLFKDELLSLVDLVEGDALSTIDKEESFAAIQVQGLARIAKEHGRGSEVYSTASQALRAVLSNVSRDFPRMTSPRAIFEPCRGLWLPQKEFQLNRLAIIVHPTQSSSHIQKRDPSEGASHPVIPIFSTSQCFLSLNACTNGTNSCSSHGDCIEVSRAGKTCFACTCGSTKDANGRTTDWAGSACQKKDYSSQFVLLVGSTVFLIIIVIGSVQILYSVGATELPNVLTSTSTAHLKRE